MIRSTLGFLIAVLMLWAFPAAAASVKISDLTGITPPATSDDLFEITDDPSGTPASYSITLGEIMQSVPDGTAAAPSLAFGSDADTGFYLAGTNAIGISTSGAQAAEIGSAGNMVAANAAGWALANEAASGTNPTLIPDRTDFDTGIGHSTANVMSLIAAGTQAGQIHSTSIRMHDGFNTTPAYTFISDSDTGIYRPGSDRLGISLGGSLLYDFNSTHVVVPEGTEAQPAIVFGSYVTTGLHGTSTSVRIALAGDDKFVVAANAVYPDHVSDGWVLRSVTAGATAPVFSLRADQDTGVGSAGADLLSLITGGTEGARVQAEGISVVDGVTAPGTVTGRAIIYVDTSDGDLKVKFGDGFVATLAADS